MSPVNTARKILKKSLKGMGLNLQRLAPNQIRGIDPFSDIQFLLGASSTPTIFDVGANEGDMTATCLARFPKANVVAFEPFKACFDELTRRFAHISNVRVENLALGASCGEAKLNVYSSNRMNSLLELDPGPENLMSNFEKTGSTAVAVDTLDDFCRRKNVTHIDLLKVDTQGYDLNVLKGAEQLLSEHRITIILLEVNFVSMYTKQPSFLDLHTHLSSFGYNLIDLYNHVWKNGHTAWCDACYIFPTKIDPHSL